MENSKEIFPIETRVSTPKGPGVVQGYVYRGDNKLNFIISTDARPMSVFDVPEMSVVHAFAFPVEELKLIEPPYLVES